MSIVVAGAPGVSPALWNYLQGPFPYAGGQYSQNPLDPTAGLPGSIGGGAAGIPQLQGWNNYFQSGAQYAPMLQWLSSMYGQQQQQQQAIPPYASAPQQQQQPPMPNFAQWAQMLGQQSLGGPTPEEQSLASQYQIQPSQLPQFVSQGYQLQQQNPQAPNLLYGLANSYGGAFPEMTVGHDRG